MAMIYGHQAYEGFAKALGSRLGLVVKVTDGACAAINGEGTITLPKMNTFQTAEQFAITCGTLVHEMAHQFYGSHKYIDPKRSRLEHECLNAVLDIADETWVSRYFDNAQNTRPGQLLTAGNLDALDQSALHDWTNKASHLWKILCTGILDARIIKNRRLNAIKRHNAVMAKPEVDAKKVWSIMKRARVDSKCDGKPSSSRFPKLIKLAKAIAELLLPYAPPEGGQGTPDKGEGFPGGQPKQGGLSEALSHGRPDKLPGFTEANAKQGASIAEGKGLLGGDNIGGSADSHLACQQSFSLLHRPVQQIAQRIAIDGDSLSLSEGLSSGPKLGQVHRLMTDGACLSRWQENEHADGLAISILLDCSISMTHQMSECAGIAQAFLAGMQECGQTQALIFGSRCEEVQSFEEVRILGGTSTHLALDKATSWLKSKSGSKWLVCVTDGRPKSQELVDECCHKAHAAGIKILVVGLICKIRMPHATCVVANDMNHLAIELEQASRMIEAS